MALWAVGLVFGFGLMFWGLGAPLHDQLGLNPLHSAIYLSGTTLFTLGIGDVTPLNHWARDLVIAEAGTGLGFVAVVIGYLPVLYQAFSRREGSIALLDGRAGWPPTASELLRRHASDGGNDALVTLLAEWERWSAEMLESHISYSLLCYFRSQHDNQSWLSAITAILDTCAVLLSIVECSACPAGPAHLCHGATHCRRPVAGLRHEAGRHAQSCTSWVRSVIGCAQGQPITPE